MGKDFLNLSDLNSTEVRRIVDLAHEFKNTSGEKRRHHLNGKIFALMMELPSTRTRFSFQVAALEMGAQIVDIDRKNTQIDRGEPISDFARVCSSLFSALIIRTLSHERIESFATNADIPVINALSGESHPCQVIADLLTIYEINPNPTQLKICWLGLDTNVLRSWIEASKLLDLNLHISVPRTTTIKKPTPGPKYVDDPIEAVKGADIIMTDVWSSMGEQDLDEDNKRRLMPYQINSELLLRAGPQAKIMHCMPIHRGEEISADVVDHPNSLIFKQAANRLHAHKAILYSLVN